MKPSAKFASITQACPCGSDAEYTKCCGFWHNGGWQQVCQHNGQTQTAKQLMQSRYSAYVLKLHDYLLATWHPSTRPPEFDLAQDASQYLGLTIRNAQELSPQKSIVEFQVKYKLNGRAFRLHEISQFEKINGQWFYVDGTFIE